AARLVFARIAVEKPNVLLLDEPTNHLDIEAIGALVEGLREFEGTVIFVSHDRHFVSELATRIVELRPEGPNDFPGTFAEYLERCGDDHLDGDAVSAKAKAQADATKATEPGKEPEGGSWEEQKKRRNRLAALPARRDKVMAKIDELEEKKKAIDARYAEDGFFERTSPDEVKRLEDAKAAADAEIETLMAEWESIEAELAAG
ncbi:MAG: ABC-F family ATPase, partial [Myxococcales bacterium]|nr:ABC-F family ATPase [Myxococcales bacterium]